MCAAAIDEARRLLGEQGRGTILFVDEVHRFNKSQQDALLPAVEEGLVVLIGATTENPFFSVNSPLLSRATLWRLEPLGRRRPGRGDPARPRGRGGPWPTTTPWPPWCRWPTGTPGPHSGTLEVAVALAGGEPITTAVVDRARAGRLLHQGADAHYDQVSALIKSIRGSDPDAALYWFARMLEGGEDARFIARRLVILASEDVGLADPLALVVADAAARAVEFVGLPEAQLNLAQAVVYLACAPKSNRVTTALGAGPGRRPGGTAGRRPHPPARRALPRGGGARPRRGVPLPPRRPPGLGGTGLPSSPGGRAASTTNRATTAPRRRSENACAGVMAPSTSPGRRRLSP